MSGGRLRVIFTSLLCALAAHGAAASADESFTTVRQSSESPASLFDWIVATREGGQEYLLMTYRRDSLLLCVDLRTGKINRIPTQGFGYGITSTADGRIFLGTAMSPGARIFEYFPETNTLEQRAKVSGEDAVYWIKSAPDGKIYGGTYPRALLFCFNPADHSVSDLGPLFPGQTHSSFGALHPSGKIYTGVGMKEQALIEYDPATGQRKNIWPTEWRTTNVPRVFRGVDDNIYAYPGVPTTDSEGKLLRISGSGEVEIVSDAPRQAMGSSPPGRRATGLVLSDGTILQEITSTRVVIKREGQPAEVIRLSASGGQKPLYSIGKGPGSTIFASSKPRVVFGYDTETEQPIDLPFEAMPGEGLGGQIDSMGAAANLLVLASYTHAKISLLDTSDRRIADWGPLGEKQDRPMAMAPAVDETSVFLGTAPAYGLTGGAVSHLVPATRTKTVWRGVIPDQSVHSLAVASAELVYLGTSIHGGTGTDPVASEAVVAEWNPQTGKVIRSVTPVPGCAKISALVATPEYLCGLTAEGVWFVLDRTSLEVKARRDLQLGPAPWLTSLVYDQDRARVFGIAGRTVIGVDAAQPFEPTAVATIPGTDPVNCGPVADSRGRLYFGQGINLVRWSP